MCPHCISSTHVFAVWRNDRIENLPNLGLGLFDLISCTGVLHHLPDPQTGLNILSASLKPGGGMFLMVYPTIFRTAIYQAIIRPLIFIRGSSLLTASGV